MKSFNIKLKLALSAILAVSVTHQSHAGLLNTTVRGGIGVYAPSVGATVVSAGKGVVFGAGIEMGVGPASIIADVLYAKRTIEILTASQTMTYIHVPVQGQLSLGLFHVSGGIYYAKGLGNIVTTVSGTSVTATYADSSLSQTDFGGVAGFGVALPLGITTLSADIRYNLGLKNLSTTAGIEYKHRSIDLLIGVTF